MNKYKIGKYIIKADSIYDAVTIVKTIKDSIKDSIGSDIVLAVKRAYPGVGVSQIAKNRSINGENYRRIELTFDFSKIPEKFESAYKMFYYIEKKYPDEAQAFKKPDKTYVVIIFENLKKDAVMDSIQIKSHFGDWKTVSKEQAKDFVKTIMKGMNAVPEAKKAEIIEEKHLHGITVKELLKDSFQKDSLTVRDVIQSLINEETSAISSYNVALETLKDHIPTEAYEAIKAIRDDEQSHVENLYAVLNGNVTPKNLEN